MDSQKKTDVLIIGASMAGSCLARQLKLAHPELTITVLDKKKEFDHWVGESMLEIFWDYACKELRLSHYLDANYFYKHGLRFFFEKDGSNCALEDMSEMGRTWYHGIPSHQIDRKKFDEDLVKFNKELGIDVQMGTSADQIDINGKDGHLVTASNGMTYQCRWLVDAAGMASPLGKKFGDVRKIETHPISTAWARIKHANHLDDLGSDAWRERVNFVNRSLSTNHFMYPGYWMWLIPIDEETFSIGVVWHHEKSDVSIKSKDEFIQFLKSHKAINQIIGDRAEFMDFSAMKNMTRISDRFFGADRWFKTGMSAAFLDPLFSSGSAFLAEVNRMIGDMIETDLHGDEASFVKKTENYDAYAHWWLDNFLQHITGNYHGSYEVHKVLFDALLIDYFGIVFPASTSKLWKSFATEDAPSYEDLKQKLHLMVVEGANTKAHHIKDELYDFLKSRHLALERNIGNFHDVEIPSTYMQNAVMRGKDLDEMEIARMQDFILMRIYEGAIKVQLDHLGIPAAEDRIKELSRSFADGQIDNLEEGLSRLGAGKAKAEYEKESSYS